MVKRFDIPWISNLRRHITVDQGSGVPPVFIESIATKYSVYNVTKYLTMVLWFLKAEHAMTSSYWVSSNCVVDPVTQTYCHCLSAVSFLSTTALHRQLGWGSAFASVFVFFYLTRYTKNKLAPIFSSWRKLGFLENRDCRFLNLRLILPIHSIRMAYFTFFYSHGLWCETLGPLFFFL